MTAPDLSFYLILDPAACRGRDPVAIARAAVRGGATVMQLRDKRASDAEFRNLALCLRNALEPTGVPPVLNDRVGIAREIGAGIHVGQTDRPAGEVRAEVGPDALVGLSTHTPDEAAAAPVAVVDYIGGGPVFGTPSKTDHEAVIGFAGLSRIAAATRLPTVAIGGLAAAHAAEVLAAGARGMAVLSAICASPDPEAAAREIADALEKSRR